MTIPGEQLIRSAVTLPWAVARRLIGLLPGSGESETVPSGDVAVEAATEALERDREAREEAIFTPDDDFFDDDEHVEQEVEVVTESADPDAAGEAPGAQLRVDEPWEGYRRMNVAEIVTRLEGSRPRCSPRSSCTRRRTAGGRAC